MIDRIRQQMNPSHEVTLYKAHTSGKIGTWRIRIEKNGDDTATMRVFSAKVLGGAEVETITAIDEGKNIGKSNETTPWWQAHSEMTAKINKKVDAGYLHEMPSEGAKVTNSLGLERPMLAQSSTKFKPEYPLFLQPKLDGHRMLAGIKDGEVMLYSRAGKKLYLPEIEEQLVWAFNHYKWTGKTLDGEVYHHDMTLQEITSYVKKYGYDHLLKRGTRTLEFHMYDVVDEKRPFAVRTVDVHLLVSAIESEFGEKCLIIRTPTEKVTDQKQEDSLHEHYTKNAYEGTILRDPKSFYQEGKRSKGLVKRKDKIDAEFEITGVTHGKENKRLGKQVGIYECKTADGKPFRITAPGNAHEKHEAAIYGTKNIGKMLTVEMYSWTPDGLPFHATALRVREDI